MPMNATHILHADRLAAYASYPAAIWAPIIFPLALAVLGQLLEGHNLIEVHVPIDLICHRVNLASVLQIFGRGWQFSK